MVEYMSLSAATMERETMYLLIGLYVCVASAKPPEPAPFCNSTHVAYGSAATLRVTMEGLQDRTKKRLAMRVFHFDNETSNSSRNSADGEILFCAWSVDNQQNKTPCTSTKANYEFVGILNDTFSLKIKSTSEEENGIYVLNAHLFKTTKCRLKLSFTDMSADTTTRQKIVATSYVSSNISAIKDAPQATDDTPDGGMIAGICFGIIVTVVCVALLYLRKRNFHRNLFGVRSERSRDLEQGLPDTSAGSLGANNTFVNGHAQNASSNSALQPLQNGAAVQLANVVEADGIATPATEHNRRDIPQNIDQNIEDSGQACGTEDNDLERAHTSAQSASSPESTPLLPKAVIEKEPSGASTGLQDDRDQLMTDDAEVCTAAILDIATTGSYVSGDDEGSPEDDFEQFDAKDLEEAKQNDATETPHNETLTEAGVVYKLLSTAHRLLGSSTTKQPEHAPVGT